MNPFSTKIMMNYNKYERLLVEVLLVWFRPYKRLFCRSQWDNYKSKMMGEKSVEVLQRIQPKYRPINELYLLMVKWCNF